MTRDARAEYDWFEGERAYRLTHWRTRGDYTPAQCCVLAICQKFPNEAMLIAPKQVIRVLIQRGVIDGPCRLTKAGERLLQEWEREDQERRLAKSDTGNSHG